MRLGTRLGMQKGSGSESRAKLSILGDYSARDYDDADCVPGSTGPPGFFDYPGPVDETVKLNVV
jgi:hypothetical protein